MAHLDEKAFKVSSRIIQSDWPTQLFAGMKRPKLFLVGGWGAEEFDFVQVFATICCDPAIFCCVYCLFASMGMNGFGVQSSSVSERLRELTGLSICLKLTFGSDVTRTLK